MILSIELCKSVTSYFKPGMMKWHYQDGLVVMAVLNTGLKYNISEFVDWAISMYDPLITEEGEIKTYRLGEYNLDQIQPGRNLFKLFMLTGNKKYRVAINTLTKQLLTQPRTKSGVFWHKEIYPWQIWLDGLFMEGPFSAMAGHADDVIKQMIKVYSLMKDPKTGLLYHAYDESRGQRWSNKNTGLSPHFWSRSLGWYAMALCDVYEIKPNEEIKKIIVELLTSIYSFQSKQGMWYQVTNLKNRKGNYLETSGSSMFCYAVFKAQSLGIETGLVEKANYGLKAIIDKYLSLDEKGIYHLGGICSVAGLGGNPYRNGTFDYYINEPIVSDDFKGTGPFILANLLSEF